MEVTKDNFENVLDEVLEEITGCSFVAVDLEISGLWRNGEPGLLDPQEEYYKLFLDSASDFICLQLGLTCFTFKSADKRYKAKTYSFYVFPRQFSKSSGQSFSCQASCIDFLVSHNFDFNKVFYKGIPYMNIEREAELTEILEERRFFKEKNAGKEMETIDIPEEHRKCVEETCNKLSSVLTEEGDEEVRVPGLNAYIRRLIYQTIKERYPNGEVLLDTRGGAMVSRKGRVDGHEPKSQLEIDEESIDKAVGFSKVIKALSKSGKMIVGHNMFLDIAHIVNNFLCNAPKSYTEFKGLLKGVFPLLLDTKFMSCSEGLRDLISNSTLNRLYSRMSDSPFSMPDIDEVKGYSYPDHLEKYHDAGFDSYVTGVCFIAMYNYLASTKHSIGNIEFNPKSEKLKKYINRVYMNNCPDNHFNFGGADPEPDRSHFFHICFPKDWVSKDIINIFSPYSRINITWINEESAWVSLNDRSQSEVASAGLCCKNPRQTGGAVISQYTLAKYRSVAVPRNRPTGYTPHYQHSPHPKRHRSSHESNFPNKSFVGTIPEEKEEEDLNSQNSRNKRYSDSSSESRRKPLDWRKQIVNYLTPDNSSKRYLAPTTPQQTMSSLSKKRLSVESSTSSSNSGYSAGRNRKRPRSLSPESRDSVIEELERDLDSNKNNQPFSSNSNWDIS